MDGMTGFNESQVSSSINNVKSAYTNLVTALYTEMQSKFVDEMSTKWCAPNAQKFFNEAFKPAIDELLTNSDNTFRSVVESMDSAGTMWASQTGGTHSNIGFDSNSKRIETSGIRDNINGIQGIDRALAPETSGNLTSIHSNATSALESAVNAVQTCGFLGGDQASALLSSLNTIKSSIDNATAQLTQQTKTAIQDTVDQYGDTAGKISQAFTI